MRSQSKAYRSKTDTYCRSAQTVHSRASISFLLIFLFGFIPSSYSFIFQDRIGHTGLVFGEEATARGDSVYYSVIVKEVLPNSPASKEGIMLNDKLVSVNGIATGRGKNEYKLANVLMEGNQNSFVTITIERKTGTKSIRLITYTLERGKPIKEVSARVFGIGVTLVTDSLVLNGIKTFVVRVNTILPNCPAGEVGMKTGDIISEINHKKVSAEAAQLINSVINVLLIDKPERVNISVDRYSPDGVQSLNFDMVRRNISPYIKNEILNQLIPPLLMPDILPKNSILNDRDRDGIEDRLDQCPDEPGIESMNPYLNGCPGNK